MAKQARWELNELTGVLADKLNFVSRNVSAETRREFTGTDKLTSEGDWNQ
jgi:hypothetical protein